MEMKILYEDHDILAIDKPSGVLTHPAPEQARYGAGPDQKTILGIFRKKYPKIELVHRLDKETSGVMLLAKNKKAHEFLKSQFQNRTINKIYHAIVSGFVKNDHGIINKPIGRSPSDFRRRLSGRGARGAMREAITEYKVLKRFEAEASIHKMASSQQIFPRFTLPGVPGGTYAMKKFIETTPAKFTYLEIKPKTGRTHQIRVHMKFLNHTVACDGLYAPKNNCPVGFPRLALHAKSIEFQNLRGKTIKVESPLPKEFSKML